MHSYVFPGDLDKEIAAVGSQPIPYMRTEEFSKINLESERILLDLIHCQGGRTIIYTGSGTGAMSAVVENYVSTKGKALAINGGSFGRRWVSLCEYYGVPVVDFKVPFAKDIDYDELERTVEAESPEVFLCQHHETSTGQIFNLEKISGICLRHNVSLVVRCHQLIPRRRAGYGRAWNRHLRHKHPEGSEYSSGTVDPVHQQKAGRL